MNTETWCNTITKIIKCPPLLADISGYYFPTNDKSSLASFLPVLGMQFCPLFPLWKPFLKIGAYFTLRKYLMFDRLHIRTEGKEGVSMV